MSSFLAGHHRCSTVETLARPPLYEASAYILGQGIARCLYRDETVLERHVIELRIKGSRARGNNSMASHALCRASGGGRVAWAQSLSEG